MITKPPIVLHDKPCPACGTSMFLKKSCCGWKKDWVQVARCMNPGCRHTVGTIRKTGGTGNED